MVQPDDSLIGMWHRQAGERMVAVDLSVVDTETLAVQKCTFAFDYVDTLCCGDGRCLDKQIRTVRKLVQSSQHLADMVVAEKQ